jgi:hypothetical protein
LKEREKYGKEKSNQIRCGQKSDKQERRTTHSPNGSAEKTVHSELRKAEELLRQ